MCHSCILSCTLLLPLDLNLFSSAMLHKQQTCGAAFWVASLCIYNWTSLCSLCVLLPLINKRNKDSFVSTLLFPVAIKPDKLGTYGKVGRDNGSMSQLVTALCRFVCVYVCCNDDTCLEKLNRNGSSSLEPRHCGAECPRYHYCKQ